MGAEPRRGRANQQPVADLLLAPTACVQSGLFLDFSGAATANGSAVILWTCSGAANQRWRRRQLNATATAMRSLSRPLVAHAAPTAARATGESEAAGATVRTSADIAVAES